MAGPIPNGFTESWYVTISQEVQALKTLTEVQGREIGELKAALEKNTDRLTSHGNRLAMVASIGIVASLLIPTIPDILELHRDTRQTVTTTQTILAA
ncbi:MAG: hypothetical protein F4219_05755 [Gammaproteobacteria bacterium]|nr:hypothetical protein [Gammaproteobacteria bacterium]